MSFPRRNPFNWYPVAIVLLAFAAVCVAFLGGARAAPLDLDHRLIVCGSDGCRMLSDICVPEGCRRMDPLPQYICEAMVKSLRENGIESSCLRVSPLPVS